MDAVPIEIWYNITEILDLGTLFSLYEVLPNHHLRNFMSSRVPNKLYNLLIEGRNQWKISVRTSEEFDIGRKAKGKTKTVKKRDYGSSLIEDNLISRQVHTFKRDEKRIQVDFEYRQQRERILAMTRNGRRFGHRRLLQNPRPPLIRLKEYTAWDPEGKVYGTTSAELRLSTEEGPTLVLCYRRIGTSTACWDFSDTCTTFLELWRVKYKFGLRSWTFMHLPRKWFQETGLHVLQAQVSEGQEDGYARSGSKDLDAIEYRTWPGIKVDDPGLIVGLLKLSFVVRVSSSEKREQLTDRPSGTRGENDEIWCWVQS